MLLICNGVLASLHPLLTAAPPARCRGALRVHLSTQGEDFLIKLQFFPIARVLAMSEVIRASPDIHTETGEMALLLQKKVISLKENLFGQL